MNVKKKDAVILGGSTAAAIMAIDNRLRDFKALTASNYRTGGKFESNINIQTETEQQVLIKAYSAVVEKEAKYNNAGDQLVKDGVINQYPVFKLCGYSAEEWIFDIKLRLQIINQQVYIDKLNSLRAKYADLMDKEERKQLLDEEAKAVLGL